ncbi:restriction endonuclease subunit S [Streptomyces sp. TP-A0874]|uniref:restriction endonuclease subunit S n=1 Tax=Streptomyces sp. TP-A0874 TaxID=549819 RepID=UPI0009A02948|nr:restriction endonuclease subunit S [Streptomyces sp. TP-A0874]
MSTIRLRHLVQINPATPAFDKLNDEDELTFLPMEAVWPGRRLDISRSRTKKSVATGYTRFQDGDVLVPKITPTFEAGRAVLISSLLGGVGAGTTELHVMRPGGRIDSRFLLYVVNAHSFLKLGEAEMYGVAGQQRVPDDFLRNLPVLLPPLEEQRRIADFLDSEIGRIDKLMDLRRAQLGLFGDGLTAQAVQLTGRGRVRGQHSRGGQIQLRRALDFMQTGSTPADLRSSREGEAGGRLPWYTPASLDGLLTISSAEKTAPVGVGVPFFSAGSVLITGIGESLGKIGHLNHAATGNQQLTAITVKPEVSGRFIAWQLWAAESEIREWAQYSRIRIVNNDSLKSFPIHLPSREEQDSVASKLDLQLMRVRKLQDSIRKFKKTVTERRQALITAAVTGQFDVSTASGRNVTDGVG